MPFIFGAYWPLILRACPWKTKICKYYNSCDLVSTLLRTKCANKILSTIMPRFATVSTSVCNDCSTLEEEIERRSTLAVHFERSKTRYCQQTEISSRGAARVDFTKCEWAVYSQYWCIRLQVECVFLQGQHDSIIRKLGWWLRSVCHRERRTDATYETFWPSLDQSSC